MTRGWLILLLLAAPAAGRERPPLPELANRPSDAAAIPGCTREAVGRGRPLPFACASRLNLEAMLAEPSELRQAAPLAPAQGDPAIQANEALRLGVPAELPAAQTGAAPQGSRP